MPDIQIRITNISQIQAAFGQAPQLMARYLNLAIQRTVFSIGRDSRTNTPVDTGRLRASTYERFGQLQGEVGTNTAYDMFVHEGTRFMRPRPYLRKAVEKNEPMIDDLFTDAVQTALNEIGNKT